MTATMQTDRFTEFAASFPRKLFIDGGWVQATDDATMAVDNPAAGEVLTTVADASPQDGRRAAIISFDVTAEGFRAVPDMKVNIVEPD